jgi:hypothetical protein
MLVKAQSAGKLSIKLAGDPLAQPDTVPLSPCCSSVSLEAFIAPLIMPLPLLGSTRWPMAMLEEVNAGVF